MGKYKRKNKRYNYNINIKSIISVHKNLTDENERIKVNDQSFYEILGFDILINEKFIPKLSEINCIPEMFLSNNLDKKIKTDLFYDTLNLIGIVPYSRKKEESLNEKFRTFDDFEDNINNAICELERPRGDYELIFPTKDNIRKYSKYFINNSRENKKFWNHILHNS